MGDSIRVTKAERFNGHFWSFARDMLGLRLSKHFAKSERASPVLGDETGWNETLSHFLPTILHAINYLYSCSSRHFRRTVLKVCSAIFLNQHQHDFFTARSGWNIENKSLSKKVRECNWNSYITINSSNTGSKNKNSHLDKCSGDNFQINKANK